MDHKWITIYFIEGFWQSRGFFLLAKQICDISSILEVSAIFVRAIFKFLKIFFAEINRMLIFFSLLQVMCLI